MTQRYHKEDAILYLVEMSKDGEKFLKIGITTTSVARRFRGFEYKVKRIKSLKSDVRSVFKMETKVLYRFKKKQYKPDAKFSGSTECFNLEAKAEILEYIKKIK